MTCAAKTLLAWALFAAFLVWVAVLAFAHCFYNWDMVAYAALAMDWSGTADPHGAVYRAFEAEVPESVMRELIADGYPRQVAESSEAFASQLPFYVVKPLYIAVLAGLHRLGVPIVAAIQAVSALGVMLTCTLMLSWLRRHLSLGAAVLLTVALAYASRLVDLARVGTPDALSVLVVLLALFLICERRLSVAGSLLLLLAIAVRTNNVVFFVLATGFLALREAPPVRRRLLAVLGGGLVLWAVIGAFGRSWWTLFHHTLVQPLVFVDQFDGPFSWALYGRVLARAGGELLVRDIAASSVLWFFLALAVAVYHLRPALRPWLGLAAANLAALFLLFPLIANWDRFLVPYYLWIAIALVGAFAVRRPSAGQEQSWG